MNIFISLKTEPLEPTPEDLKTEPLEPTPEELDIFSDSFDNFSNFMLDQQIGNEPKNCVETNFLEQKTQNIQENNNKWNFKVFMFLFRMIFPTVLSVFQISCLMNISWMNQNRTSFIYNEFLCFSCSLMNI
jgi:hypothetical protein